MLTVTACVDDDNGPSQGFDAGAWRTASVEFEADESIELASPNERCQLVEHIADVWSPGMSADEVLAELGDWNMSVDDERPTYTLGVCGMGVDYDEL